MLGPVDEIKHKLDVVEVISGYIKLQKAGRNWRANCPFHAEKTPSFFVSPERQIWHCFGCGKGGDIFGFVKEIEGLEFGDTLRLLAQRAGVVLKKQDPKTRSEKQRLYEICELAAKFFAKQLEAAKAGQEAKKYLLNRGINGKTIADWRLGFAPDDWHALDKFLQSRGYNDSEIINSGLVVEKEIDKSSKFSAKGGSASGGQVSSFKFYDRFRNRIIFPLFDINGQAVGFAGRVAPGEKEDTAKYINTPQTLIYDKSRILYGLHQAKLDIRSKNQCIIVEGNTDVIMSHQAGIKNTVASSGTALTEDHLKIIKRYTENLVLAFDLDVAGDTATKRAIDLALSHGFNVRIIQLKEIEAKGKIDPADIIKKNPKQWQKAISQSQGIVEFYFASALAKFSPKDVSGKKEIAKIILPVLKKISNRIEQAHWIQELAKKLQVQEKFLAEAIKEFKPANEYQVRRPALNKSVAANPRTRQAALEEELLAILLCSVEVKKDFLDAEAVTKYKGVETLFINPDLIKIVLSFKKYLNSLKQNAGVDLTKWQKTLTPELSLMVDQLILAFEVKQPDKGAAQNQFDACLRELKKEKIKQELNALQLEIKSIESSSNKQKLDSLLKKFRKTANELVG
jgi:DNA primase